jgi:hypothetical protein
MSYIKNLIIINCIADYKTNKVYNLDLSTNNSILIKNSSNLIININNKINKITVENSHRIFINITSLIIGFEISKSKYIIISNNNKLTENNNIPMINIYKSYIYLLGCIDNYKNTLIMNEFSNIYNIEI